MEKKDLKEFSKWYTEETGYFAEKYLRDYEQVLANFNTPGEIDFIEKTLQLQKGCKILDLACGHGRHSIGLAQRNYVVTGVDQSECFLEIGKKKAEDLGVKVEFIKSDIREYSAQSAFDVVVNMFCSFGYLENEEEDLKVLKKIASALKKGGKFFIETSNPYWILKNFQTKGWQENNDGSIILFKRSYDYVTEKFLETRRWIEKNGSQDSLTFSYRLYNFAEYSRMLQAVGLTVVAKYGNFEGGPYNTDSKRLILIAEKT